MNNKGVIAIVRGVRDSFQEDCFDEIESLDFAIKALEEERPHGEWVHLQAIGDYKCSICGCENLYKYANEHERWIKTNSNFCPNCGADMRVSISNIKHEERPQGKWIPIEPDCRGYTEEFECSNCNNHVKYSYCMKESEYPICPYCGAEMSDYYEPGT